MKSRPFGVTVLALLAGLAAVLAAIHALQSLGIIPYVIGPIQVHASNFWSALMWGLLVWVYVWLVAGEDPNPIFFNRPRLGRGCLRLHREYSQCPRRRRPRCSSARGNRTSADL